MVLNLLKIATEDKAFKSKFITPPAVGEAES